MPTRASVSTELITHYPVGVGVSPSRISHITIEWRILNILAENVALGESRIPVIEPCLSANVYRRAMNGQ